jgi:hypothetical protein
MSDNNIRVEGQYNGSWLSIHSDQIEPAIRKEAYMTYGRAFDVLDFFQAVEGGTEMVSNRTIEIFERGNIKANISLGSGGIATGGAGANISFLLSASSYDANGNAALRVRQVVYIPQQYQPAAINTPQSYVVLSRTGSAGGYTYTAAPLDTASQISTLLLENVTLSIGYLPHAVGTNQPTGTTMASFKRDFSTGIYKEHVGFEGGMLSFKQYNQVIKNGKSVGFYDQSLNETEFLLDDQLNEAIFLGQKNTNTSVAVQTNSFSGGTSAILSTEGIWQTMASRAQQLLYTSAFEHGDYIEAKTLLESQGVMDTEVDFPMGSLLFDDTEQADLEFLKAYSGGTDLKSRGMNLSEVGFQGTTVFRSNIKFNKVILKSFSNPFTLGNPLYALDTAGYMIPTSKTKVTINGKNKALNNVTLGFLGHGGENRRRVMGQLVGMNGFKEFNPINAVDGMTNELLSELMVIFTNVNQCIQIRKQ